MKNRRNFYRILHIQPEAPGEIIKASYRGLMTKLNAHPDRGGDNETAALINQAYAVLGDPLKRKKYDEMLHSRYRQEDSTFSYDKTGASTTGRSNTYQAYSKSAGTSGQRDQNTCIFCNTEIFQGTASFCMQCESPLTPAYSITTNRICELFGRRTVPRISKTGTLTIYFSWPHPGYPAWLRDLSRIGFCILTTYAPKTGQNIKFNSVFLNGIARVVAVRSYGNFFAVHATFLTAEFVAKTGVFVSEKA